MKILWHSNPPIVPSGYGNQTRLFLPRIRDLGYDPAVSATSCIFGTRLPWEGMTIYPMLSDPYGREMLFGNAKHFFNGNIKSGLVISFLDIWVYNAKDMQQLVWAPWVPIDHDPCPPTVLQVITESNCMPIVHSKFGLKKLEDHDIHPYYVPLGVETDVFKPMDQKKARDFLGLPQDAFVIGMVAANKGKRSRKSFPEVFTAFAHFAREHDDAVLYLHTENTGVVMDGVNLKSLGEALGIPQKKIFVCDQYNYSIGFPDKYMAAAFNSMDVLANPSTGEGFGVPIIETQACGVPVIVTDITSMSELCGAGWSVGGTRFITPLNSMQMSPDPGQLIDAFTMAYKSKGDQKLKDKAREFALQYDADLITERYWKPTLKSIEEKVDFTPRKRKKPKAPRVRPKLTEDFISVIVSTKSITSKHAKKCFKALAKSTADHELIVIQRDHEWSFSSAVNQGLAAAKGKYLLMLNDDCYVEPDTLERLRDAFSDTIVGIVGGLLLYTDGTHIQHAGNTLVKGMPKWNTEAGHILQGRENPPFVLPKQDVASVTGALMMVSRELLDEIGKFDEGFLIAFEDSDLCYRAKEAGYRVIVDPIAQAIHEGSVTRVQEFEADQVAAEKSREHLTAKYGH